MAQKRVKVHSNVLGYRPGDEAIVDDSDDDVASAIAGEAFEVLGAARKADVEAAEAQPSTTGDQPTPLGG